VVVRWRVLLVPAIASEFQLRVLVPNGSGGYTVAGSSAGGTVPKDLSAEAGAIGIFATRLPVPAGGYVGVATDSNFTTPALGSGTPGTTMSKLADGADGANYSGLPTTATSVVGYDADIEADGDGDGYGDVTQDSCPSSATVHEGPCPPAEGGSSGNRSGSPSPGQAAPAINGFRAKPKRFRAKPLGHTATRGTWGTKLKLDLSATAIVTLTIQSKAGKSLQTLTKSLGAGSSSIAFNGQIRRHRKRVDLRPGPYRVSARARNDAGTSATVEKRSGSERFYESTIKEAAALQLIGSSGRAPAGSFLLTGFASPGATGRHSELVGFRRSACGLCPVSLATSASSVGGFSRSVEVLDCAAHLAFTL
jgi:hypothetical protein